MFDNCPQTEASFATMVTTLRDESALSATGAWQ